MAKRGYKLQELVAHTSDVNCLSIGKKTCRIFLTGGDDCKVNVWAIGKPTSLLSLSGHTRSVQSVTFDSAEGHVLAGSSDGTIKLWDLEEAKIVRTLTGHRSSCTSVAFHPFGEFFASGSLDTNMKTWDIRRKGCIQTYKGHTRGIRTIKFTPDGRWVVTGGEDNVVKIWDLTAGKLLHDFNLHYGIICCIDFHPFEFLLATGSADQTIKFWDLETFELIGSAGPEATGVRAMAFHPDGRTLLCGLEENLKVFSWEPIICHDVVDVGWSTLGDLSIHGGKVVGCSYHQNHVGVWIADISAESGYNESPSVSTQLFHSEASNSKESIVEATNLLDESNKALASSIQHSNPVTLEDGLIQFGKDIERANSVVKSNILKLVSAPQGSKDAKNPRQSFGGDEPLSTSGLEENLRAAILESQESAISEAEGLIIDSSVGEIDLSNMQVMDNEDLVELKELGSGGFGTVYHGKWRGIDVAIKRIKKSSVVGQQSGQYRLILESLREAGILSKFQHPNVVSLYGFVLSEASSTLAIVTELVGGGSLRNILHREDIYLDHCKRLAIAKGAASGMEYLHLKNIVHFDLKCDNLLVDLNNPSHPICKVTDFGLSKIKKNTLVTGSFRGTLPWMAPELLKRGNNKVSEKIDVYSFGIVMWEILTGKVPYDDMPQGEILGGMYDNTLRPPVPASCDPEWRELMEQCWDGDPQQRPSFTQIASRLHRMLVVSQAEASE